MRVRGLMCQSTAVATAVCMPNDSAGSVIVPSRPRVINDDDHTTRLINYSSSSRLFDSHQHHHPHQNHRHSTSSKRSVNFVPSTSAIERQTQHHDLHHHDTKPNPLNKPPVASSEQVFQVVVMRVALHCQGCAGKLKKHLSKMEGVTAFSIDLETKRVTVMGHVSPTGVLESISKVKRAEFWPAPSQTTEINLK